MMKQGVGVICVVAIALHPRPPNSLQAGAWSNYTPATTSQPQQPPDRAQARSDGMSKGGSGQADSVSTSEPCYY